MPSDPQSMAVCGRLVFRLVYLIIAAGESSCVFSQAFTYSISLAGAKLHSTDNTYRTRSLGSGQIAKHLLISTLKALY